MAITLNLPSVLAAHTGGARTIEATGRTLGEAVADVAARYPALAPRLRDKEGKPYPFVNFYLNDEDVRFRGGFAAPVQDGDERSEERRVGKSVDLGGRRIIKKKKKKNEMTRSSKRKMKKHKRDRKIYSSKA